MEQLISGLWSWMSANGPIGVLGFLGFLAAYRFSELYQKAQEKRIEEAAKMQSVSSEVKAALEAHKELLKELIVELRNRRRIK